MPTVGRGGCSIVVDRLRLCSDPDPCCDDPILIPGEVELPSSESEECVIVPSTIARESISGSGISEESHPDIDMLRSRRYDTHRHTTLLSESDIVSALLVHLCHEISLSQTEIENSGIGCEESFVRLLCPIQHSHTPTF
jgi:hypothetical protein